MEVDHTKCVGCGNCVAICTMGVISVQNGKAQINQEECVECGTCYRVLRREGLPPQPVRLIRRLLQTFRLYHDAELDVCPTGALVLPELTWPRILRREFSDPLIIHSSTGVGGRGTEEIKTNDVTNRLKEGDVGFVVELGRPGLGSRLSDLEKFTLALAKLGVDFEPKNPVTFLMSDVTTGKLKDDVLNEKVLSAIIEFKTRSERVPEVLQAIERTQQEISTVCAVGISARCGPDGSIPYVEMVESLGYKLSLNGKTNLGLGRATLKENRR